MGTQLIFNPTCYELDNSIPRAGTLYVDNFAYVRHDCHWLFVAPLLLAICGTIVLGYLWPAWYMLFVARLSLAICGTTAVGSLCQASKLAICCTNHRHQPAIQPSSQSASPANSRQQPTSSQPEACQPTSQAAGQSASQPASQPRLKGCAGHRQKSTTTL